jgi:quinol monooxygenase YgiN
MTAIATIITGRTQLGCRDELAALFEEHLAPRAEANAAQPVVVWVPDEADGDTFHPFEIYTDPAAMAANAKTDWFAAYMGAAAPILDGPPTMRSGVPRWWKGVTID